jgi:hypothetical protein
MYVLKHEKLSSSFVHVLKVVLKHWTVLWKHHNKQCERNLNEFNTTTVLSAYHLSHFATNLRARWLAPFTREFSSSTSSLRWSRALFWLQIYHIMCNIRKSNMIKMFFFISFNKYFFLIYRSRLEPYSLRESSIISLVLYYVGDKKKVFPNTTKNSLFNDQFSDRIISISIATELLYNSVI